jgi:hypothetical protein
MCLSGGCVSEACNEGRQCVPPASGITTRSFIISSFDVSSKCLGTSPWTEKKGNGPAEGMEVCKQCVTSDLNSRGPFSAGTLALLSRS